MSNLNLKQLLLCSSLLVGASFASSGIAFAQDVDSELENTEAESILIADEDLLEDEDMDSIVVTGSRIKRNTFTSISPIQSITTEISKDAGLFDPASILQQSDAASGQQIDATFNGFVLDNGPGSQTLNLRGLGANSTLVLINGRRMAPAGAEGSPGNASINLIPASLVDRYDILLDGASSVYGSDAVAGVANIILRKDFDGLEIEVSADAPEQSGGEDYTLSASYGINSDRGFIGFGAEYDFRDAVRLGDRDFLAGCETDYEITTDGEIRTVGRSDTDSYANVGIEYPLQACQLQGLGRRIRRVPGGLGFVYNTPGSTNVGIPNFSETSLFSVPIDADGDGVADVDLSQYSPNGEFNNATFISEQKKISLMSYGELVLEGDANVTPYFEALYTKAEIAIDSGSSQLFTVVPAGNQFNPCNPNQPNGVDCGLAADSLLTNPNYLETFRRFYFDGANGTRNTGCFGFSRAACTPSSFGLLNGALGPQRAGAGVIVEGDRDITEVTQEQLRLVGGIRGDIPWMNVGTLSGWSFDTYASFSRSEGNSTRPGIRDDRLHFALGFDPNIRNANNQLVDTAGPCVAGATAVSADIADGCVPINLFAPSLYDGIIGEFATQAERDYVFDDRDFKTIYEQTVLQGFVTGSIYELPAGPISVVIGAEYRFDNLDSQPDNVAEEGLFFGFFADSGGFGQKWTKEMFGEIDVPLIADQPLVRELNLNFAGRITEDEFYGLNETYSVKAGWRPFDSLLLKSTFGTSYRAPNLRENFLLGQTAFPNVFDPCVTPDNAVDINGNYIPANDDRDQTTLDNCSADGIDPRNFSPIPGNQNVYSTEREAGGSLSLDPETSTSFTIGFAFEQPFTDWIDINLNVGYFDIEVQDTVIEPSAQFIVNDCYINQPNRQSTFCNRISRSPLNASANPGSFDLIQAGFINQDEETVRGIDINTTFAKEVTMFSEPVDLFLNVRANKLLERSSLFIDQDTGEENFVDVVGEFSFPEWTASGNFSATWEKFRATWTTRFVQSVEQRDVFIDDFSDTIDGGSATCSGPERGDVQCRDVGFADDYFEHAVSLRYTADTWSVVVGVQNLFDKAPPLVDGNEVFSVSNAAIGAGYSYDGREYFASVRKTF